MRKNEAVFAGFVSLCILGGSLFFYKKLKKSEVIPSSAVTKISSQNPEVHDKEILTSANSKDSDKMNALIRLSMKKNRMALDQAIRWIESPSSDLRAGAIRALGYFDEAQAQELLKKSLQSKELSVRINALSAIAIGKTPASRRLLEDYLKMRQISDAEIISAYAAFINSTEDPVELNHWKNKLLKFATEAKSENSQLHAYSQVLNLMPRDPRSYQLALKVEKENKSERVKSLVRSYLKGAAYR